MSLITKAITVVSGTALVAALVVVPAAAHAEDEVTQTNKTTGYRSRNTNRLKLIRERSMTYRNIADVSNSASVNADTGGNDQNKNTKAGDQDSGEVHVGATVVNDVNASMPDCGCDDEMSDVDVDQKNEMTGAKSRNHNRATVRSNYSTKITNRANISNSLNVNASTGNNDQNKNTTAGDQTSGDVHVDVDFGNFVN